MSSIVSKYFAVTDCILMEYRIDQYSIDKYASNYKNIIPTIFYMYEDTAGRLGMLTYDNYKYTKYWDNDTHRYFYPGCKMTDYENGNPDFISIDRFLSSKEIDKNDGTPASLAKHRYSGIIIPSKDDFTNRSKYYRTPELYFKESSFDIGGLHGGKYGNVIHDKSSNRYKRYGCILNDTIRLYLITGYMLDSLAGISIRVRAKVGDVQTAGGAKLEKAGDNYIILLDWFMPKDALKYNVHWIERGQLYMNGRFYDRYIDISVPSSYLCGLYNPAADSVEKRNIASDAFSKQAVENDPVNIIAEYNTNNIIINMPAYPQFTYTQNNVLYNGYIDPNADLLVDFSVVNTNECNVLDDESWRCDFIESDTFTMAIRKNSSSDQFNVCILENEEGGYVEYYPTYGTGATMVDFDVDVMYMLNYDEIRMFDDAADDYNKYMDDFIETYGADAMKWYIINEVSVTYHYYRINVNEVSVVAGNLYTPDAKNTEYISNTIDYTDKTSAHGAFWRTKWIPSITELPGLKCEWIVLNYTCRLVNRYNNREITKMASLVINANKYTKRRININNISTYKIINKNIYQSVDMKNPLTIVKEKRVRTYYDATNLVIKNPETGQIYNQGQMILRLKHTSSNYALRVYTLNSDNIRIPYDMTGQTNYKLVFPSIDGSLLTIKPNTDSTDYNLGIGQIIFYISSVNVKKIMAVPDTERYFALMTDYDDDSMETSLYEGKVEYYG